MIMEYNNNKKSDIKIMEIRLAKIMDIDGWMMLVNKVKNSFPGLETTEALNEHRTAALDFIRNNSAICTVTENRLVGSLLFSRDQNILCFLAVDPDYRRHHISEQMIDYMLGFMNPQGDGVVTTYREGVSEGIAASAFYKHLGFSEGKLKEEFGSPVQEFILKR